MCDKAAAPAALDADDFQAAHVAGGGEVALECQAERLGEDERARQSFAPKKPR